MAVFLLWLYICCNFFIYLLAATCMLCASMPRRKLFALRLVCSLIAGIVVTYGYSVLIGSFEGLPYIAGTLLGCLKYFLCFFLVCAGIWVCFSISFQKTIYYCIMGYAIQHIGYSLFLIADAIALEVTGTPLQSEVMTYLLGEVSVMAAVFALVFIFLRKYIVRASEELRWKPLIFPLAVMMAAAAVLSTFCSDYTGTVRILLSTYAVLLCAAILFMLYKVYEVVRLGYEKKILNAINIKQREQFEISKKNIEYINIKCHDLRKQLDMLRGGNVSEEKLREMQKNITIYDCSMHTGNKTLDVLLSEKGLYCEREGIKFTCIADGEKLGFMDTMDVCAIFGNLLDNAAEAAVKVRDPGRRLISVKVTSVGNIIRICVYNTYELPPRSRAGEYLTTKSDKREHGFGLLSVRQAVERNGGEMKITTENGVFNVDIVIAAPKM